MAYNYIPKIVYGSVPTTISFSYPPSGFNSQGISVVSNQAVNYSANGSRQTCNNYLEEIIDLEFSLVSDAIKQTVDTFMITHALLGENFRYYPHASEATYYTYTLSDSFYNPMPSSLDTSPNFTWAFKLSFRRTL